MIDLAGVQPHRSEFRAIGSIGELLRLQHNRVALSIAAGIEATRKRGAVARPFRPFRCRGAQFSQLGRSSTEFLDVSGADQACANVGGEVAQIFDADR